jgi:DNA-binding transcriptional ArsR family regulator
MANQNTELVTFFKALADSSRLKIVGLLAQRPYTVEQLAAMLDLRPSTVSHHLSRLTEAGLVSARAEGYYSVYQLEEKALEEKNAPPVLTRGSDRSRRERGYQRLRPQGHRRLFPAGWSPEDHPGPAQEAGSDFAARGGSLRAGREI